MDLLRFATAGSVDDGKSTLIGRLLYDTKNIFEDQKQTTSRISKIRGEGSINLALFTDGLKAEREQGITIDVAYRYFATSRRKFILADTPGHIEYTRNMITGVSSANVLLILIDAKKGILEQTRRHTFIAELLSIKHIIVCINKMDLVAYDEAIFHKIRKRYLQFVSKMTLSSVSFIPISALDGDNVVSSSTNMPWYQGASLLYHLENIHLGSQFDYINARFPVQYVIRPQAKHLSDYRGYAGMVFGGTFKKGDEVLVLPSGFTSKIKKIDTFDGELTEAFAPLEVTILLEDDVDLSRGDMLVKPNNQPQIGQDIDLMVCWMVRENIQLRKKYILKHTSQETRMLVKEIVYKVDINTLKRTQNDSTLSLNDIGRIRIRTSKPLFYDTYKKNKLTGSLIIIDESTHETAGVGMIL